MHDPTRTTPCPTLAARPPRRAIQLLLLALLALALPLGACQNSVRVGQPLTDQVAGEGAMANMSFWHGLSDRPVISNDEAFHALLLLTEDQAPDTYEARLDEAKQHGWVPDDYDQPADAAITRGRLAVAVCRILEIDGGVMMHLLGPTPRYATRELRYLNIYPASSPQQTIDGGKFVALISRIEDWQRSNTPSAPPPQGAPAGPSDVPAANGGARS